MLYDGHRVAGAGIGEPGKGQASGAQPRRGRMQNARFRMRDRAGAPGWVSRELPENHEALERERVTAAARSRRGHAGKPAKIRRAWCKAGRTPASGVGGSLSAAYRRSERGAQHPKDVKR